jgi:hypothetical protein
MKRDLKMSAHEFGVAALAPALRPLTLRLNAAVLLERALPAFALLAGLCAGALLLLKMIDPRWLFYAHWSFLLVAISPVYGFWLARRRRLFFTSADSAELADHLFHNDGQVSAYYEKPDLYPRLDPSALTHELSQALEGRSPRFRPAFFLKRLAPVLAFVLAALLIPPRPPVELVVGQEAMKALTDPLIERLRENEEALPEERLNDLLSDLQELRETKDGLTREKWEAIENLETKMLDSLDQSQQAMMNVAEAFKELTNGSGFKDNPLAASQTPQFKTALQDLKDAMNLSSQILPKDLMEQLQKNMEGMEQMCEGGKPISGEDRAAMMEGIQKLQAQLQEQLEALKEGTGDLAGRGGVDRGRADAAMVFGEEVELSDAQYEKDRLKNRFLSPEDLVDMGITALEPEPNPGVFSPGTLQSFGSSQGQAVSRTRVSPSQKEVVSRYFSGE